VFEILGFKAGNPIMEHISIIIALCKGK